MTHRGAVYFARGLDSGLVKIGFSRSVRWRVRAPRVVLSPLTRAFLGRRVRVSSLPVSVQLAAMVARLRRVFAGASR